MNTSKKILATAVAASTMAFASVAPMANAELSASAGVASSYLWRGQDLGNGNAAVWGDLSYSANGFTAGAWVSSGDSTNGTEYDLYVSYGGEIGDFGYSLMAISYLYPEAEIHFGDFSEIILGLSYGPVSFAYYDNIANDGDNSAASNDGYSYASLGLELGSFSFTVGQHMDADLTDAQILAGQSLPNDDLAHFDIAYSYNDNLAFIFSTPIDSDSGDNTDATFVVSYSIDIE